MENLLANPIDDMTNEEIRNMIIEINTHPSLSIKDRLHLYFGYLKIDHIDSALCQAEYLHDYIVHESRISDEYIAEHPDIMITFDLFHATPDGCGGYWVDGCSAGEGACCESPGLCCAVIVCFGVTGGACCNPLLDCCC